MRASEFTQSLKEIGYADDLMDLPIDTQRIVVSNSKVIGTSSTRDVYRYLSGPDTLYFFTDGDIFDALVFIKNNRLYAIKNYTNNKGLIYALFHFIIDIIGDAIILDSTDSLTKDGLAWIVGQIKRGSFNITDHNGVAIDPIELEKEWEQAKIDNQPGKIGVIIRESSQATRLRENETNLMRYDIFGVYHYEDLQVLAEMKKTGEPIEFRNKTINVVLDPDYTTYYDDNDEQQNFKLVRVNATKFDDMWKPSWQYIGKNGVGQTGDRYQRFGEYIATTDAPIHAATVSVDVSGDISFTNGRHRFAWLRDAGMKNIPVAMDQDSINNVHSLRIRS